MQKKRRCVSFAGTKFGGGGTPEAVPLWRDATGQEARAGPEGIAEGDPTG